MESRAIAPGTAEQNRMIAEVDQLVRAELPDIRDRIARRAQALGEESLAGSLRRATISAHLPIDTLAAMANTDRITLSDFLDGDITLPADSFVRLAEALNLALIVRPDRSAANVGSAEPQAG